MPDSINRLSLIKPSLETPFRIDFEWWKETDSNWRIFLHDFLCAEHKEAFAGMDDTQKIDAIDPVTAEITQVDGLLFALINHCAKQEGFYNDNLPLVSQIFRILLANGNKALTAVELSEITGKPARTILITLGGHQVYKGIRPYIA